MSSREGGKKKPLKAPKQNQKELDEHDLQFKQNETRAKKEAAEAAKKILAKKK